MAQLSSDRPEPTTILAVTAWRDSKYAATGVVIKAVMDNTFIMFGVRFFDAALKDRDGCKNRKVAAFAQDGYVKPYKESK